MDNWSCIDLVIFLVKLLAHLMSSLKVLEQAANNNRLLSAAKTVQCLEEVWKAQLPCSTDSPGGTSVYAPYWIFHQLDFTGNTFPPSRAYLFIDCLKGGAASFIESGKYVLLPLRSIILEILLFFFTVKLIPDNDLYGTAFVWAELIQRERSIEAASEAFRVQTLPLCRQKDCGTPFHPSVVFTRGAARGLVGSMEVELHKWWFLHFGNAKMASFCKTRWAEMSEGEEKRGGGDKCV